MNYLLSSYYYLLKIKSCRLNLGCGGILKQNRNQNHLPCAIVFDCVWLYGLLYRLCHNQIVSLMTPKPMQTISFNNYDWQLSLLSAHSGFIEHWIPKKVFVTFDNVFHVYLMREFQKYGRNWILTVAFWGQTKAGQKCAARWAELAVLFCR